MDIGLGSKVKVVAGYWKDMMTDGSPVTGVVRTLWFDGETSKVWTRIDLDGCSFNLPIELSELESIDG